jgi:hypothetical protein
LRSWRGTAAVFAREIPRPLQISLLFTMSLIDFAGEFPREGSRTTVVRKSRKRKLRRLIHRHRAAVDEEVLADDE